MLWTIKLLHEVRAYVLVKQFSFFQNKQWTRTQAPPFMSLTWKTWLPPQDTVLLISFPLTNKYVRKQANPGVSVPPHKKHTHTDIHRSVRSATERLWYNTARKQNENTHTHTRHYSCNVAFVCFFHYVSIGEVCGKQGITNTQLYATIKGGQLSWKHWITTTHLSQTQGKKNGCYLWLLN